MKHFFTILCKDLRSLLIVPTGAIVASLFSLTCGIVFAARVLSPGGLATMNPVFDFASWLILFLCPAVTMRLIAEEKRVGTWELLLSSPVTAFAIAKGKFLAAFVFLFFVLCTTIPLIFVLELYSSVDYGALASGYLGLLLLGGAVIGTGLVVSSNTTSQTVAYLVTTFFWLTISLATKVLPSYLPTRFADIVFGMDPELRTSEFTIGLIDSANIVYFLSIILLLGWVTVISINKTKKFRVSIPQVLICTILLLISLVSVNVIAMNSNIRWRFDATGTRAYTLSEQSQQLIESIEKPWKIVVLLDDKTVSRSVLKQVDEVLRRYQEESDLIEVERINPADPLSIEQYDSMLRELIAIYSDELERSELAIQEGIDSFEELMLFASSVSTWAESLASIEASTQEQETLRTLAGSLALLGNDGGLILKEVDKAMKVDASQPLPQISIARDILVAANGQWAQELSEVAWWLSKGRTSSIATICASKVSLFESMAKKLAYADDNLRRLGDLELGQLAMQMASGEGTIIMSSNRALMIPASVVFPKRIANQQTIETDQRFRGEHIISSAMRSLQSLHLPTVVFVHSEEGSMLRQRSNNVDLWAARGLLESSRIKVKEWIPFDGVRPDVGNGPVVWVVIPPSSRAGLTPSNREQALLDATNGLLFGNESVMINLQPSLLPRYGQKDPWAELVRTIGVEADTKQVLVEQVAVGPNQLDVQKTQLIHEMNGNHLISRSIDGLQLFLPFPIEVEGGQTLIEIQPSEDRWMESEWESESLTKSSKDYIDKPVQVATAIEHHGDARAIVVGSGGWMLTWAADRAISLGGNQVAMVNPGNSEFLLSSVEWLSGLDEWIAASPLGNQSSRVEGLSQTSYLIWSLVLIFGMPSLLIISTIVTSVRRGRG